MATKGSAAGFAAKRPDHLQTKGRRWPPNGQQQVLLDRDQIPYLLRAGDDHQRSAASFVAKRPNYLLSEGRVSHQKVHREFVMEETVSIQYEYQNWLPTNYHDIFSYLLKCYCKTTYLLSHCMMVINDIQEITKLTFCIQNKLNQYIV